MTDLPRVQLRATPAPRHVVAAWSSWDFGSNAFNTVMWSFVFSVYVTSVKVAPSPEAGHLVWSWMQVAAGIVLAVTAPLMGAWADRVSNRRRLLTISTLIVVAAMAACWFVLPEPHTLTYVILGAGLLCLASVVQEVATVFYNGMLVQISTPSTIGRISGTGWALGYFGGVLCLVIVLYGFVTGGPHGTGLFGLPAEGAVNLRAIALFCAAFLLIFSLPVMIWGPGAAETVSTSSKLTVRGAYAQIGRRIAKMWRQERNLLHFLLASAVFRDGLAAVFAFARIIAAGTYGFSSSQVIVFGIAANVIAGVGTWVMGHLEGRLGAKRVILVSLMIMIMAGLVIIVARSSLVFWIGGLTISSMVGAVQSSSRTLLTRMTPEHEENETFGLYATVGRAVSFIAPLLFALCTLVFGVDYGLLGIVLTLAAGLALTWKLRVD